MTGCSHWSVAVQSALFYFFLYFRRGPSELMSKRNGWGSHYWSFFSSSSLFICFFVDTWWNNLFRCAFAFVSLFYLANLMIHIINFSHLFNDIIFQSDRPLPCHTEPRKYIEMSANWAGNETPVDPSSSLSPLPGLSLAAFWLLSP